MPQAVIFDMDGVLVDSYRAHLESWQRLARLHGRSVTEEQFAATFGRTSRENILGFWPDAGEDQIGVWDHQKEAFYRQILQESFPAMDGANELLEDLHRAGFRLAVGSSGPRENVEVVVRCLRAGKLFDAAVNGMDVDRGKPDPAIFLAAARKLGVAPADCAVVEDAPVGVQAARRAGMVAVALTGTAPAEKLREADLVVGSLRDLSAATFKSLLAGQRLPGH